MGSTVKWLRLTEAIFAPETPRQASVAWELTQYQRSLHRKGGAQDKGNLDIPGVYVNQRCTSYRVVYTAVERDKRGHPHRRQRTRNFHRNKGDYGEAGPLRAAVAFKNKMDAASCAGVSPEPDHSTTTVDELFEMMLEAKARRPMTVATYRAVYRHRIQPTFGTWLVSHVSRNDLERWAAEGSKAEHLAAHRVAVKVLKAMFNVAHKRGMVEGNPALVLSIGSDEVRSIAPDEVLTAGQVDELAAAIGDRYSALIFLLAYGGLRLGEAVALERSKVDVRRGRVLIDRSASEVEGRLTFGPTKTRGSTRTITLPRFVVDHLSQHMERYPTETGLLFSAPDGGPLRPNNFRRRVYGPALERADLPHQSIHALRHVCASQLAAAGGNAVEIAARLGHSNAGITQRVYVHLLATRDERLAELQQEAFTAEATGPQAVTAKLRRASAAKR